MPDGSMIPECSRENLIALHSGPFGWAAELWTGCQQCWFPGNHSIEGVSLEHAVPKQAECVSAGEQICAPAWPSLVEVAHEASMTQGWDLA